MEEIEVTKKPVRIVRAITKEQSDDEPGDEHEETKSRKVELKRESDGESKKSKVKILPFIKMVTFWMSPFFTKNILTFIKQNSKCHHLKIYKNKVHENS